MGPEWWAGWGGLGGGWEAGLALREESGSHSEGSVRPLGLFKQKTRCLETEGDGVRFREKGREGSGR